jgi:hypothetical protein
LNFSLCRNFFSRLFTCRIASCMHWEDEFRCISMIFGKFNVILVVFCYENILEPVSEMGAFFERIVYYSTARLAAEQSETKFPAVSRCHSDMSILVFCVSPTNITRDMCIPMLTSLGICVSPAIWRSCSAYHPTFPHH